MSTTTSAINLASLTYHEASAGPVPNNPFGVMGKAFYVLEGDIRIAYHAHVGDGPLRGRWVNYTFAQILVDCRLEFTGLLNDNAELLAKKLLYTHLRTPYNAISAFTIVVEACEELAFLAEGKAMYWESTWTQ